MFCPKCGTENKDDVQFCGNCGASLRRDALNALAASTAVPAAGAAASVEPVQKAVKKNGRVIGIAAAVVVIVVIFAGIATGGFGLFGSGVAVKGSTDAYTWEELSKISEEIAGNADEASAIEVAKRYNLTTTDGKLDGTQVKNIQLRNGQTAQVQIVGFRHDDKTSGGKAGITFIFKDAIATHSMNSTDTNDGGWERSEMRSWLAGEGMRMLPQDLCDVVVAVDKKTNNVGETQSISSVTVTSDKLWLFSPIELSDTQGVKAYINEIWKEEGYEYQLFIDQDVQIVAFDGNNATNGILQKSCDGYESYWWERSPTPYGPEFFQIVNPDGNPGNHWRSSYIRDVVPGFCI